MESNNLDKNIKEKLLKRTLEPSESAWERLSLQLDEQPQEKRKGWFFYIGAAASILLLVFIGVQVFSDNQQEILPKEIIVDTPIDTAIIKNKIDKMFDEIPVEKAIVKKDGLKVKEQQKKIIDSKGVVLAAKKPIQRKIQKSNPEFKNQIIIAHTDKTKIETVSKDTDKFRKTNFIKQNPNSRIKVNSEALLFAVTNSPNDVKKHYAKHNTNREEVLKTIKSELKKSSITINPETILAEVERTIDDDDFKNNFMKSLKTKISSIATAIASRNN